MGGFVGHQSMNEFIGGASMIDLVKHRAGQIGFDRRKQILLIKQSRIFRIINRR